MNSDPSAPSPVIDSHHHLWRYSPTEYGWIDDTMATLRRDFLPKDLVAELTQANIDGAIAVQARQTLEETYWLLELAQTCPQIGCCGMWAAMISSSLQVA